MCIKITNDNEAEEEDDDDNEEEEEEEDDEDDDAGGSCGGGGFVWKMTTDNFMVSLKWTIIPTYQLG